MIGVYEIVNLKNNKRYIGSSTNLNKRFRDHRRGLITKKHRNKHLMNAWYKYGESAFVFRILQLCETAKEAAELEQELLDRFFGEQLYNIKNAAFGVGSGVCHPNKGKPLTEEHKRKISNTMKGMIQKTHTKETLKTLSRNRSLYKVTTPDGVFYGFANAGRFYGISEVAAKKRCKIPKFNWSYESINPKQNK